MSIPIILAAMVLSIALINLVFPNAPRSTRIKVGLSITAVSLVLILFTSNHYKHWRYFDENKINIVCEKIPPITADSNKFYYRYVAYLKNNYPEDFKITDFHMKFQTSSSIDNNEILLSDLAKSSLIIDREEASILSAKTETFSGKQNFALSIDCSFSRNGYLVADNAATLNITYKFFGTTHSKSIYINPMSSIPLQTPRKEWIIFDVLKVLDHRMLPKSFIEYHYLKIANESGDRRLDIYCSDNKRRFLKVKYSNPHGLIIFESELPIHNDFDAIRVVTFTNDSMKVCSRLQDFGVFRQEKAAEYFREGLQYSNRGEFRAGADAFKKVIEVNAEDYQAWFNYGLALENAKDYKQAIAAYNRSIEIKGDYRKAYGQMGVILIKTGDEPSALRFLYKAIEIDPKYAFAYYTLSYLQKKQGKRDEAFNNLKLAIEYEHDPILKEKYKTFLKEF